ncbi:hypothetical protein C8R44DRAFT_903058 [Mycena epipterygia]|nr:hypothetical protein C8R44DRAFT_903058 [Mycena epipterygia]
MVTESLFIPYIARSYKIPTFVPWGIPVIEYLRPLRRHQRQARFHMDESDPQSPTESSSHNSSLSLLTSNDIDHSEPPLKTLIDTTSHRRRHPLQLASVILHILLVLVNLALLIIGVKGWEHNITFPVERQTTVSFLVTAVSTTIGTLYGSGLLFLTQKIVMQSSFRSSQTLTAAHDSISAWRGLISAMITLYNQLSVPALVLGALSTAGYLGCISILHVTLPASLSVETFNSSFTLNVATAGPPELNLTDPSSSYQFMTTSATAFLPWIRNLDDSQTDTNLGIGEAGVSAMGLNITCGYLPAVIESFTEDPLTLSLSFGSLGIAHGIRVYNNTVLIIGNNNLALNNSIILYTALEVLDSDGNNGHPATSNLNITIPHLQFLQFLQCSKTSESSWVLTLLQWSQIITRGWVISSFFTDTEEYMMQYLDVDPLSNSTDSPPVLKLHDIENGLSVMTATLFWMGGNIPVDIIEAHNHIPPVLLAGNTTAHQEQPLARLNINLVAVSSGLATSFVLILLCISFLVAPGGPPGPAEGTGLLHTIFWIRRNPERVACLQTVEHPTELNLRVKGSQSVHSADISLLPLSREIERDNKKTPHSSMSEDVYEESLKSTLIGVKPGSQPVLLRTSNLRRICITLHIVLLLVHMTLFGIMLARKEHNIVFSLNIQSMVSFWYKVIATAFGTTYYSIILYLTQKLAISDVVQTYSTLTSAHDSLLSWDGLGSSLTTLHKQIRLPVSVFTTLSVVGYLSAISTLHVTTPALFSVQTFNITVNSMVETEGLPEWNGPDYNATITYIQNEAEYLRSLQTLPLSQTLGLFNGSLYDTLTDTYPGNGAVNISAVGFNITCGFLPAVNVEGFPHSYWPNISFGTSEWTTVFSPGPDLINVDATVGGNLQDSALSNSIILYTTNQVLDSDGNTGAPVALNPMFTLSNVSAIQFLQCQIKPVSRTIIPSSLNPVIYKTRSKWQMYEPAQDSTANATSLVEGATWAKVLPGLRGSGLDPWSGQPWDETGFQASWGDIYLIEQLGLDLTWKDGFTPTESSGPILYLHDIENALSNLVASVFWTAGHVRPFSLTMESGFQNNSQSVASITANIQKPPSLITGNTTVSHTVAAARLDMNPVAVSLGLGASCLLLLLAIAFSAGTQNPKTSLNGLGLLQIIWVLHHHPYLSDILEHVEDPTDYNLREAGLVKLRMSDAEEY